jgi:hypothetical protein
MDCLDGPHGFVVETGQGQKRIFITNANEPIRGACSNVLVEIDGETSHGIVA